MRTVIVLIYAAHFPAVHVDRFARSVTGLAGPTGQCLKMYYAPPDLLLCEESESHTTVSQGLKMYYTPPELLLCYESHNIDGLSVSKNVLYTPGATTVL